MGYFSNDAAPEEPQYKLLASLFPESWPAPLSNLFCGLLLLLTILEGMRRLKTATTPTTERVTRQTKGKVSEFNAFQREYLAVYFVIMLADWLQGTNMYTLYSGYGVSVSTLFLTGFSSSLVFGTFVGLLVDASRKEKSLRALLLAGDRDQRHGARAEHAHPVVGPGFGGISTSLLFSAFESWMVAEHRRKGFPEAWLAKTFGLSSAGNGAVAVVAGLLAQVAADVKGDIGPFQLAIALTVLALVLILRWPENYGKKSDGVLNSVSSSLSTATKAVKSDRRVALLAAVSALFEGATYTFVFMWVPRLIAIYPFEGGLPTGLIFASFMVCITIGGVIQRLGHGCFGGVLLVPVPARGLRGHGPLRAGGARSRDASNTTGAGRLRGCFNACAGTAAF